MNKNIEAEVKEYIRHAFFERKKGVEDIAKMLEITMKKVRSILREIADEKQSSLSQ